MVENYGCIDLIDNLRSGRVLLNEIVDEAIQAWHSAVQLTASRPRTEGLMGMISVKEYQGGFRAVLEKPTPPPTGLHYTLWKVLAKEDNFVSLLGIIVILLFMHSFTNQRWTKWWM